jgi:hypothetical protein
MFILCFCMLCFPCSSDYVMLILYHMAILMDILYEINLGILGNIKFLVVEHSNYSKLILHLLPL